VVVFLTNAVSFLRLSALEFAIKEAADMSTTLADTQKACLDDMAIKFADGMSEDDECMVRKMNLSLDTFRQGRWIGRVMMHLGWIQERIEDNNGTHMTEEMVKHILSAAFACGTHAAQRQLPGHYVNIKSLDAVVQLLIVVYGTDIDHFTGTPSTIYLVTKGDLTTVDRHIDEALKTDTQNDELIKATVLRFKLAVRETRSGGDDAQPSSESPEDVAEDVADLVSLSDHDDGR